MLGMKSLDSKNCHGPMKLNYNHVLSKAAPFHGVYTIMCDSYKSHTQIVNMNLDKG